MHAGGDGLEPHRAVVDGVEAAMLAQQHLGGTDVGVGLLAADVLLAGLVMAMRRALLPRASLETPMMRPGMSACGVAGGEEGGVGPP